MAKKYVGPENPPPKKDEKNERLKEQEELKEIKIERQKFADEKKKFKKERDNFQRKLKKGAKTMEPQEVERELKVLRGNITELLGIEKERQRQDAERRSKEEEEKRLKSIVGPLQDSLKGVKEIQKSLPKIHCASDGVCFTDVQKRDEYQAKLQQMKKEKIEETSKPKKEEKKGESKPSEPQIVSDKDRNRMAEADKWLDFAEPLRDKRPERVTTAVVTAATDVYNEVAKSEPNAIPELVKTISSEIIQEIRKGLVVPKSMSDEEVAKLGIERCQGENAPAYCKIFKDQGFNIQKKRQGGMLGSPWEDIK